jgi:hypothetical protein
MPLTRKSCPGIRSGEEMKSITRSATRASSARLIRLDEAIIFVRLIETPTKTSPVSAAEAPSSPTKKFSHPFIICSFVFSTLCEE